MSTLRIKSTVFPPEIRTQLTSVTKAEAEHHFKTNNGHFNSQLFDRICQIKVNICNIFKPQ